MVAGIIAKASGERNRTIIERSERICENASRHARAWHLRDGHPHALPLGDAFRRASGEPEGGGSGSKGHLRKTVDGGRSHGRKRRAKPRGREPSGPGRYVEERRVVTKTYKSTCWTRTPFAS